MPQRGLTFIPPLASHFFHVIAPNSSSYNVIPRPMFFCRSLSLLLFGFWVIKREIRAFAKGGSLGERVFLSTAEREALRVSKP